ncbi:MAG TPA: hypothetical protein VFO10_29940 [Oligoflexus sp.]|uniref:hypothetical protein n=1 Tax=Oligoflexus sp. TaxID=1971216 RepID=UPI002D80AA12|nr:hypothetical protein [Oligoflexus sp.]HET9241525.1 hypothetical protein [Oligoflexus sp.]
MKEDLKTRLFANVLLGANEEPPVFKHGGRSTLSLHAMIAVTFAAVSVAGLLFLVIEKIKPLF